MLNMKVETNSREVAGWFHDLYRDQIPYATARAINATAIDFQKREREGLEDRFTIRRPWVLRGIKINREDFATKEKPEAIVHVDQDRSFLIKFEKGGVKRPRGRSLVVPVDARRTKSGVVSRTIRPRALGLKEIGGGRAVGDKRTFLIRKPGGRGVIFQWFGRRGSGQTRTLFMMIPSAKVDPRLHFEDTAKDVVRRRFEENFEREFDRAIRTAR